MTIFTDKFSIFSKKYLWEFGNQVERFFFGLLKLEESSFFCTKQRNLAPFDQRNLECEAFSIKENSEASSFRLEVKSQRIKKKMLQ